ncbi:MAG: hypothetical protein AB8F95_17080 [Bacteroidia bacterium]
MHWNEKIAAIKERFSEEEFSVPHVDRKRILKNIETIFIRREKGYYDLNNHNRPFCNWWDSINTTNEYAIEFNRNPIDKIEGLIATNESFWIAGELPHGVMLYKAKKDAILELMSTGRTWTDTFYIIHLKYEYLISFKFDASRVNIKTSLK